MAVGGTALTFTQLQQRQCHAKHDFPAFRQKNIPNSYHNVKREAVQKDCDEPLRMVAATRKHTQHRHTHKGRKKDSERVGQAVAGSEGC